MARYLTVAAILVAVGLSAALVRVPQPVPPAAIDKRPEPASIAAEARSALLGLDEIDVPGAGRTLALDVCNEPHEQKSEEQLRAELEAQQQQMLRVLGASADPDHLLVAALVSWKKQPPSALPMLERAAAMDPRSPLIASQMMELCLAVETCSLSTESLERQLIAADKVNAMAWVQVARGRLKRADESGALTALREAAAAPLVSDHFIDYVLLFDRGLAASADLEPFDRTAAAIGHAAAVHTTSFLVSKDCFERAEESAEWRDACLRLGQQFEQRSRTLLAQVLGMEIQQKMYEYGGDTREQQQVNARRERSLEEWLALASRSAAVEQIRDVTMMRRYLETFASNGEQAATRYLAEAAEARLQEHEGAWKSACPTP